MAVLSHLTRTCESPQEKERRAYPNKYIAIFYLQLYQCNLMKVHGALVEKTRGEEGSHNLRPLRPTLVSAAFHQSPLEVVGFEGWKHQSTSRLVIFLIRLCIFVAVLSLTQVERHINGKRLLLFLTI